MSATELILKDNLELKYQRRKLILDIEKLTLERDLWQVRFTIQKDEHTCCDNRNHQYMYCNACGLVLKEKEIVEKLTKFK